MLGKLFRHDMRALSKTLRWVVLGVVALALLASLVTAIELRMSVNNYADFLQNTQVNFSVLIHHRCRSMTQFMGGKSHSA